MDNATIERDIGTQYGRNIAMLISHGANDRIYRILLLYKTVTIVYL